MKQEKFKIIQFIRELILYVDTSLENFPKKDVEIKNRIRNISYDLLEVAYKANETADKEYKMKLVEEVFAKVKVLDFFINLCYDKKIVNEKRYVKIGNIIGDIIKYSVGWYKAI